MSKKKKTEGDEVEELLRAAEDEMVLNLNLNSHMSRVTPSYLDSDLDRRFQALRSRTSSSSSGPTKVQPKPPPPTQTHVQPPQKDEFGDDLIARFAALKGSDEFHQPPSRSDGRDQLSQPNGDGGDIDNDEVEKVIQWAIDAARLDPSPPTDDEDEDDDDSDTDKDDDQMDGDKKGQRK